MVAVYRDAVPEHLMTMGQLHGSGRKPADTGSADGWLEREFEGDLWRTPLYDVRLARPLPLPPNRNAGPSDARQEAEQWARAVLRDKQAVVLDTELTDFQGRVIEVAVVAMDGTVLLETLVNPAGAAINPHAQRKHGITAAMLASAPTMDQLWPQVDAALQGKTIIAWNAPFDQARIRAEHQHVNPGTPEPEWLARTWQCAMRQHAAWVGEPDTRGSGFRHHKLEGNHRATGDCRALLHRLKNMTTAADRTPPAASRNRGSAEGDAVHQRWPQILDAVRARSRSTEAMLTNAHVREVRDHTLELTHRAEPLSRRLAMERNLSIIQEAVATVLGPQWSIHVQQPSTPGTAAQPEPVSAPVEPGPSESYRDWMNSHHGQTLESWIEINPGGICRKVTFRGDSRSDMASAFWAVNHTARCAVDDPCRTILRLADEGHFDQANQIAEGLVLR